MFYFLAKYLKLKGVHMNRLLLTIVLIILTGCGADDGSDSAKEGKDSLRGRKGAQKPNLASIALDLKADLPECSADNDTQLAYVKEDGLFYSCSNLAWEVVDVASGKDGANGKDGEDGIDGVTTIQQIAAQSLVNHWTDSATGKEWIIGAVGAWEGQACGAGYHSPSYNEGLAAYTHGIFLVSANISGPNTMWTSYELNGNGKAFDAVGNFLEFNKSAGKGLFCIKN